MFFLAELQATMSRDSRMLLFLHHNYQVLVSLKQEVHCKKCGQELRQSVEISLFLVDQTTRDSARLDDNNTHYVYTGAPLPTTPQK